MELTDYLRFLRKYWATIIVLTIIGATGGAGVAMLTPKSYLATTELFVAVQSSESNSTGDVAQGSTAAQSKVKSYVSVATSARVLQPVIKSLDLSVSNLQLARQVTASSPTNSVLIDISVADSDPVRGAAVANAIGRSLSEIIVDDLETPTSGGPSLVKLETLEPAIPATTPSSPRVVLDIALGLLVGALTGLGVAALRSSLDTRIHGAHDVEALTSSSVIGETAFDPGVQQNPLVVQSDPRSPRAESYRALRTNLQFINLNSPVHTYMTTSANPGEGKSTTTVNLALALVEGGARVALVDADLRRPRLADMLGLEGAVGLTDVLIGRVELEDSIQPWGRGGLSVLPAGSIPPNPSELLGSPGMKAIVDDLNNTFDYVLIDTPPVLSVTDALVLTPLTAGTLMVAASNRTTRTQLRSAVATLERVNGRVLGVVVTMLSTKSGKAYGYNSFASYYGSDVTPEVPFVRTSRRTIEAGAESGG